MHWKWRKFGPEFLLKIVDLARNSLKPLKYPKLYEPCWFSVVQVTYTDFKTAPLLVCATHSTPLGQTCSGLSPAFHESFKVFLIQFVSPTLRGFLKYVKLIDILSEYSMF